MTIYLATAPKSNSSYRALKAALSLAERTPGEPVPLHIRNAPTALHAELGYHAGYQYAHDSPEAFAAQEHLPASLKAETLYAPGAFGFEKEIERRLDWWNKLRARLQADREPDT
jgi:putative ATPase